MAPSDPTSTRYFPFLLWYNIGGTSFLDSTEPLTQSFHPGNRGQYKFQPNFGNGAAWWLALASLEGRGRRPIPAIQRIVCGRPFAVLSKHHITLQACGSQVVFAARQFADEPKEPAN